MKYLQERSIDIYGCGTGEVQQESVAKGYLLYAIDYSDPSNQSLSVRIT